MKLKHLTLTQFRNYQKEEITFGSGVNILYGENAQGKTNVLEAIYLFSSARSHRGVKDKEMIRFSEKESQIQIVFDSQGREQEARFNLFLGKNKKLFVNGIEQRKVKALLSVFATVIFSPEDLNLIKDGPEARRRFLDIDISQLRPNYYGMIREYKKVLELKNNLLKKDRPDLELLAVYNEKIAVLSAKIILHRHQFLDRLNELSNKAHSYISDQREELRILYHPAISPPYELRHSVIKALCEERLAYLKKAELEKRTALFGPHRDDVIFLINEKDARIYGSQGQQRSVVLSLKLAEYEFMKEVLGEPPVLLLDDILSELDGRRQEKLLRFIRENQTILTCTDKDLYQSIRFPYRLFQVKEGTVLERQE